ncbi:MAG: PEP-CTERM sorting domain-containing protein [Planctomycetota bacterium]
MFTAAWLFTTTAEGEVVRFFTTNAERLPFVLSNGIASDPFIPNALQAPSILSQQVFAGSTGLPLPGGTFEFALAFDYDFDTGRFTNLFLEGVTQPQTEFFLFTEDGEFELLNGQTFFPTIQNGKQLLTFRSDAQVTGSTFIELDGLLPAGGGRVDFVPFNMDNADLLADPVANPTLDLAFLQSSPGTGFSLTIPRNPSIADLFDLSFGGVSQAELDDQVFSFSTEVFLYGVVIPEPTSIALLGLGMPLLFHRRRRAS